MFGYWSRRCVYVFFFSCFSCIALTLVRLYLLVFDQGGICFFFVFFRFRFPTRFFHQSENCEYIFKSLSFLFFATICVFLAKTENGTCGILGSVFFFLWGETGV